MFKYFTIIKDWLEPKYKMIAQPPPGYDPGDTAQREGMYAFGIELLYKLNKCSEEEYKFTKDRYAKVLSLLEDPNHKGILRRYPDTNYWGGRSNRFSRDQAIPNIVAMGTMNKEKLIQFFLGHFRYSLLFFMTNTRKNGAWPPGDPRYNSKKYKWKLPDLTILSFWGSYIRSFKNKWLFPILFFFDLDLLGGSLIKCFIYGRNRKNKDDLNFQIQLLQAKISMPTFISNLALKIYKKYRPYPSGSLNADNSAQGCLNAYFKDPGNPGPKLDEVYREITNHYFK